MGHVCERLIRLYVDQILDRNELKMIYTGFTFDNDIKVIINSFLELPIPFRHSRYSYGEIFDRDAGAIENEEEFNKFIEKSDSGFFLLGPGVSYNFKITKNKPILCDGFIEVGLDSVELFLERICELNPIFGFACEPSELIRRNRISIKLNENEIEAWVGFDVDKYVPGLYWMTIMSEDLRKSHSISLDIIKSASIGSSAFDCGLYMFRFHERPDQWRGNLKVEDICRSLPGVFHIEDVLIQLSGVSDYLKLTSILREWK